tara:strand:+ start:46 stop:489 length:444 start_codon:yes stop_codon:yes gene_type:complete
MIHKIDEHKCLNEIHDHIEIKTSNIENAGLGLFATTDIPENILLGWYKGTLVKNEEYVNNPSYGWRFKHSELGIVKLESVINFEANPLAFVNGADPKIKEQVDSLNLKHVIIKNRVYYKTIKPIKKGEELIINYGDNYFNKFNNFTK